MTHESAPKGAPAAAADDHSTPSRQIELSWDTADSLGIRRVLLTLPCGHRVDLAGHGVPPDVESPWFRMADTFLSEDEIDGQHRTLTKWITFSGRAVAETVVFMHGGTDSQPQLQAVARFRGQPEGSAWHMHLEPMEAAS